MDRIQLNIELYKKVFLVRMAEEKIREYYHQDGMKTPTHLSIGEEAIVAGVCHALSPQDQLFGTYRSHGIYLARTLETDRFFSELYGKSSGVSKGKTGSMHLNAIEEGFLGSSAVVGTPLPVAVGTAYANKVHRNGKVVCVFFGDGAVEEGVFWESLNVACLKNIPIVFICEDNDLAIHSHKKERQAFRSLTDIVRSFNCLIHEAETTDPEVIFHIASSAIDQTKTIQKPSFLYLKYYRYLEHVGVHDDFKFGYRSKENFDEWLKKDPVMIQRKKILSLGVSESEVKILEQQISQQIQKSIEQAIIAPFPSEEELLKDVYA